MNLDILLHILLDIEKPLFIVDKIEALNVESCGSARLSSILIELVVISRW